LPRLLGAGHQGFEHVGAGRRDLDARRSVSSPGASSESCSVIGALNTSPVIAAQLGTSRLVHEHPVGVGTSATQPVTTRGRARAGSVRELRGCLFSYRDQRKIRDRPLAPLQSCRPLSGHLARRTWPRLPLGGRNHSPFLPAAPSRKSAPPGGRCVVPTAREPESDAQDHLAPACAIPATTFHAIDIRAPRRGHPPR
jgi:hypothetical protein